LAMPANDLLKSNTSRMKRELHVRFCERLEGENPSCLLSASAVKHQFTNPKKFLHIHPTHTSKIQKSPKNMHPFSKTTLPLPHLTKKDFHQNNPTPIGHL
jgi:hypothetical protein